MVELPPQGADVAVPAVHLAEESAHSGERLGLTAVPGDFAFPPSGRVEDAGGTLAAGPLQDFAPEDGTSRGAWMASLQWSPDMRSNCTTTSVPMVRYSPCARVKQSIAVTPFPYSGAKIRSAARKCGLITVIIF